MKYLFKYLFLVGFVLNGLNEVIGQVSVAGYSTYAVGVEHPIYKDISGEFRVFTNEILYDAPLEIQFYKSLKMQKYHQVRIGIGINGSLSYGEINTLQVPIQLHLFPLVDIKRLSFVIELAPQWLLNDSLSPDTIILRNLWGIRYTLGD